MKYSAIIFLCIICITGCEEDNNIQEFMDFIYPLTVGNNWEYEKYFTLDYDATAESNGAADTTFYSSALVEVITNEVIFDSIQVYNLETTYTEYGSTMSGHEFYNNVNNFLINYAYIHPYMFTPKTNSTSFKFNGKFFSDVKEVFAYLEKGILLSEFTKEDSIHYDPVHCLEYPLVMDNQWLYRAPDNPFSIEKEIVGFSNIDVPAGRFECCKVRWIYPDSEWNDNVSFHDYVSSEGLVKRLFEIRDIAVYNTEDPFGEPIGFVSSTEETYLTNYEINN